MLHTPLKLQAHLVGQGMQQQHSLPPGSIDLIPLHRDAGEAAKPEVIYCAKLPTVPVIRRIINKCARLGKALGLITKQGLCPNSTAHTVPAMHTEGLGLFLNVNTKHLFSFLS